jgi:rubrerythrin
VRALWFKYIRFLRARANVEKELIADYKKSEVEIKSKAVKHLLTMHNLDSQKHLYLLQTVIDVLEGNDILSEEKEELIEGLKHHMEIEKESIDRANKILKNVWIRETKGLNDLMKRLRDDEREHHKALQKLSTKFFFRQDPFEFGFSRGDKQNRFEKMRI